jgi:chromosome segregation ATPase
LVEEAGSSSQPKKKYPSSNEKPKDQHNLTQKIRKLEDSQYYFESVNFNNSIGEDFQKTKEARVEISNKNTARTEKKQSIISINSKEYPQSETLKEPTSTHQILLNEIAKLH